MSGADEDRRRAARAEQVALFRYQLIREAADPGLTVRQRGRMVRELAGKAHEGPFGEPVTVSRATIDRWIRAWRPGGFAALSPPARQVTLRTDAQVLELAAGLKRENPDRTAAQVQRILRRTCGWSPSPRTLLRHFGRLELSTRPGGRAPAVFGRFEAPAPNEMWTGDALHGPHIAGRKAYLFAFLDDHSRAVMAARWGYFEDTVRLAAALRPALAARGVPARIYVVFSALLRCRVTPTGKRTYGSAAPSRLLLVAALQGSGDRPLPRSNVVPARSTHQNATRRHAASCCGSNHSQRNAT